MKTIIISLITVLIIFAYFSNTALAYDKKTHQYIVAEAEKIFNNGDITGFLPSISNGAHDEDVNDVVYKENYGYFAHFWDADMGDEDEVKGIIFGIDTYPNAYMKAKELWKQAIDFYAKCDKKSAYDRLGRISHLIADMSLPAHAHEDFHWPEDDSYEDWMAENHKKWNSNDAMNAGGIINIPDSIDPLYYLMYTTNQRADYFASDDYNGDLNDRNGWMDYTNWPTKPRVTDDLEDNDNGDNDDDGDLSTIGSYTFVYSIRATATLYKIFFEKVKDSCQDDIFPEHAVKDHSYYEGLFGEPTDFQKIRVSYDTCHRIEQVAPPNNIEKIFKSCLECHPHTQTKIKGNSLNIFNIIILAVFLSTIGIISIRYDR